MPAIVTSSNQESPDSWERDPESAPFVGRLNNSSAPQCVMRRWSLGQEDAADAARSAIGAAVAVSSDPWVSNVWTAASKPERLAVVGSMPVSPSPATSRYRVFFITASHADSPRRQIACIHVFFFFFMSSSLIFISFGRSFRRLSRLLRDVGSSKRHTPPGSIVVLAGDVHHAYLAEVGFPRGSGVQSRVYQAVCSPFRNPLDERERRAIRVLFRRATAAVTRALARAAGVPDPDIGWRFLEGPYFDNQVASLTLDGRRRGSSSRRRRRATPRSTRSRLRSSGGSPDRWNTFGARDTARAMSQENVEIVRRLREVGGLVLARSSMTRASMIFDPAIEVRQFERGLRRGRIAVAMGFASTWPTFGRPWTSLRLEPEEFIRVGEDQVVVAPRDFLARHGRVSRSIARSASASHSATARSVASRPSQSKAEALEAAGLSE